MQAPAVNDPWDGVKVTSPTTPPPQGEDEARLNGLPWQLANGDVIVPNSGPTEQILGRYGSVEAYDDTLEAFERAERAQDYLDRAEAAEQLLAPLKQQAELVPHLQSQVADLTRDCDALRRLAAGAQAQPSKPAEPALDDSGKPLGEYQMLPADPFHTDVPWAINKLIPRLRAKWGKLIIALIGGAGTSKTWTVEQLMAQWSVPTLILNCKGSDPNDWYAYRSVENGQTKWTMGRLAQAIIDAGDKKACIFIDEFDTSSEDFKYRMLSLLNTEVHQRRLETEAGSIAVGPNLQFILAMNGNGSDPASRHRGTVPQALFSRATWIEAEMMTPVELASLLLKRYPTMARDDAKRVAGTIIGLMTLQNRGTLDADITVRTAVKVCEDWDMGEQLAWAGALLDGLSDRKMREAADAVISTGGVP